MDTKVSKVSIFDFDQTVSAEHTFKKFGIDDAADFNDPNKRNEYYMAGKEEAKTNTKADIEKYLLHTNTQVSAIATFHNNPFVIAGYISAILNKEFELIEIISEDDKNIAVYKVGEDESVPPFMISYVPKECNSNNDAYKKYLSATLYGNKNTQIEHLISKIKPISEYTLEFFDDDVNNYDAFLYPRNTKKYPEGTKMYAHHVNRFNKKFEICTTEHCVVKKVAEENNVGLSFLERAAQFQSQNPDYEPKAKNPPISKVDNVPNFDPLAMSGIFTFDSPEDEEDNSQFKP